MEIALGILTGIGAATIIDIIVIILISLCKKIKKGVLSMKRKSIKKEKRKFIKRIKNLSKEQFEAYYTTLVDMYNNENFHRNFVRKYTALLKEK